MRDGKVENSYEKMRAAISLVYNREYIKFEDINGSSNDDAGEVSYITDGDERIVNPVQMRRIRDPQPVQRKSGEYTPQTESSFLGVLGPSADQLGQGR